MKRFVLLCDRPSRVNCLLALPPMQQLKTNNYAQHAAVKGIAILQARRILTRGNLRPIPATGYHLL